MSAEPFLAPLAAAAQEYQQLLSASAHCKPAAAGRAPSGNRCYGARCSGACRCASMVRAGHCGCNSYCHGAEGHTLCQLSKMNSQRLSRRTSPAQSRCLPMQRVKCPLALRRPEASWWALMVQALTSFLHYMAFKTLTRGSPPLGMLYPCLTHLRSAHAEGGRQDRRKNREWQR